MKPTQKSDGTVRVCGAREHNLRNVDVDIPWHALPKKDRNWILFTEDQQGSPSTPASHQPKPARP